jgi:hypothetical protein
MNYLRTRMKGTLRGTAVVAAAIALGVVVAVGGAANSN